MDYSQFLYMPQELGLLVVFLLVFLFDTFGPKRSQSSLPVLTAVLFGFMGYFSGHARTLFVMAQALMQTLLVRLPLSYLISLQPDPSLVLMGLAAPLTTLFGIALNAGFFIWCMRRPGNRTRMAA